MFTLFILIFFFFELSAFLSFFFFFICQVDELIDRVFCNHQARLKDYHQLHFNDLANDLKSVVSARFNFGNSGTVGGNRNALTSVGNISCTDFGPSKSVTYVASHTITPFVDDRIQSPTTAASTFVHFMFCCIFFSKLKLIVPCVVVFTLTWCSFLLS